MFVALSFVGKLPYYIIESIHQIRLYFDGDIYLIINDLETIYLNDLNKYNVNIIDYNNVMNCQLNETVKKNYTKFCILPRLKGREELFIRSIERFFLLQNLMKQNNIEDCLFLELDNLIYDNPINWLPSFSKSELCYMYDNRDRCSSGLMYVKNADSLNGFLDYLIHYIENSSEFLNEMTCLYRYYIQEIEKNNLNVVSILPTYWNVNTNTISKITNENYDKYNDSIFDALSIGCFLLGLDPYHTKGKITTGLKAEWGEIDYTKQKFEWRIEINGLKRPYVWNGEKWVLINNLHVHSKDLKSGLSKKII